MLIYEYKLDGTPQQYAAIEEAIRVVQFIRNKALALCPKVQGNSLLLFGGGNAWGEVAATTALERAWQQAISRNQEPPAY